LKHNAKKTISSLEGFCSGNTFQHFFTKQPETTLIFILILFHILSQSKAHTAAPQSLKPKDGSGDFNTDWKEEKRKLKSFEI